jgi:hypothetical protein
MIGERSAGQFPTRVSASSSSCRNRNARARACGIPVAKTRHALRAFTLSSSLSLMMNRCRFMTLLDRSSNVPDDDRKTRIKPATLLPQRAIAVAENFRCHNSATGASAFHLPHPEKKEGT